MADFDLAGALQAADTAVQTYGSLGTVALDVTNSMAKIAESKKQDSLATAQAASTIDEVKNNAIRQQEQTRMLVANRLGTNANDAGWFIGQQADIVKDSTLRLEKASKTIQDKESVSFIDNPLGYLYNQLTINKDIAEYNDASRQKDIASDGANKLEKMTSDSFINNNALVSTVNDATIAASKIVTAHQFNREASDAALQGLRANLEGVQMAAQASGQEASIKFEANNALNRERSYGLELQRLQLSREELDIRKQAQSEKLNEDSFILKRIQKGYFNLSGQTLDDAKAKDAILLYKSKQPNAVGWFESGMASYMISPDGNKPVISLSPFDASTMYATKQVQGLPLAQTQVLDKLVEYRRDFSKPDVQAQLGIDPKDKTAQERAFNSYVQDRKKLDTSSGVTDSIYSPMGLENVAAANKNMAALPVWQKVLAPAVAASVDISSPKTASGLVISALQAGKINYQEALGLQQMYAVGLDLNNQSRNFIAMGMEPANSYSAKLTSTGPYIGTDTVNVVDPKSFSVYLNKALAKSAVSGRLSGVN